MHAACHAVNCFCINSEPKSNSTIIVNNNNDDDDKNNNNNNNNNEKESVLRLNKNQAKTWIQAQVGKVGNIYRHGDVNGTNPMC